MYTITTEFVRFSDVHLGDLFGATGVYVLWDARAQARPTYIGEGHILKRLSDHSQRDGRRFAHPIDGYVATISGSTRGVHKTESQVVESLLLEVARDTDREPTVNVHPGNAVVIGYLLNHHPTLRIEVRGWDPLRPPGEGTALEGARAIKVRLLRDKNLSLEHGWRVRRHRAGVA
jgi:hypothetical protein